MTSSQYHVCQCVCMCMCVCVCVCVWCVHVCVCVCVCVLTHPFSLRSIYLTHPLTCMARSRFLVDAPKQCEGEVLPNCVDPLTTRGHHTHYKVTSTALARRDSMDDLKRWTVAKIIGPLSNAALAEQFWPVRKEISCSHPDGSANSVAMTVCTVV